MIAETTEILLEAGEIGIVVLKMRIESGRGPPGTWTASEIAGIEVGHPASEEKGIGVAVVDEMIVRRGKEIAVGGGERGRGMGRGEAAVIEVIEVSRVLVLALCVIGVAQNLTVCKAMDDI
jgi:hypothetical protein